MKLAPLVLAFAATAAADPPAISVSWTPAGSYAVSVGGAPWLSAPAPPTVCVSGARAPLVFTGSAPASGTDALGAWTGTTASFTTAGGAARVQLTSRAYAARAGVAVLAATFPDGLNTARCGSTTQQSATFPAFDTAAARAGSLGYVSWRGEALSNTATSAGLAGLGQAGLDAGPVIAFDAASGTSLMWSTLDHHKIVVQATAGGTYSMGPSAAIPSLPANWSYAVLLVTASGGATAAAYTWGGVIIAAHNTTRLPSVTLTDVGYYTDDGACGQARDARAAELRPRRPLCTRAPAVHTTRRRRCLLLRLGGVRLLRP